MIPSSSRSIMLLCGMLSVATSVSAATGETAIAAKPWKPTVAMTDEHKATCLVYQGDTFPNLTLLDLDGTVQQTDQLRGKKKLTVIVFWTSKHAYAFEQFRNLSQEVVKPMSGKSVAIIAINEDDTVEKVKQLASKTSGIANLRDSDATAFKKVATGRLPRTYLLDENGKIVWMDIEYSQSTRRELANALRFFGALCHYEKAVGE